MASPGSPYAPAGNWWEGLPTTNVQMPGRGIMASGTTWSPYTGYSWAQPALGAGSQPLALGAGEQLALNAGSNVVSNARGLASQITGDAATLGRGVYSNQAGGQFIPTAGGELAGSQLGAAVRSPWAPQLGKAAALRGLGYFAAGQAGAATLKALGGDNPGTKPWEAALKGAGAGAMAGSVVPGVGNVIGALAGATIAEGNELLRGGKLPPIKVKKVGAHPTAMIVKTGKLLDLSQKERHKFVKRYRKLYGLASVGATGPKQRNRAAKAALGQVLGEMQAGGTGEERAKGLAAQSTAASFLNPILARQAEYANALAGIQEASAATLPPEYQNLARVAAAGTRANQANLSAAYASQIAAMPGQKAMEEQFARQKQIEAQAFSATLQQADQSGSGGSLDDLVPKDLT